MENKPHYLTIPGAIIIAAAIIAIAIIYVKKPAEAPTQSVEQKPETEISLSPITNIDHILGNPNAPIKIVEFSDPSCPFCKTFHPTMKKIIEEYGPSGKVAWVYRQFPLTELHPNALSHARAAECAAAVAGNDAFWKFAQALFANQPADPSRYGELAVSAGITGDAFATCYASAASMLDARIMADRQNALDAGASGTPYSLILVAGSPPIVMAGAYPYDEIQKLINHALAN